MIAFLADWILLILAAGVLIPAFAYNECRSYTKSTIYMTISVGLAGWFFLDEIKTIIQTHGLVSSVLIFMISYSIFGLITAFFFWISFNIRAKEKFEYEMGKIEGAFKKLEEPLRTVCKKYAVVCDRDRVNHIFDDENRTLQHDVYWSNNWNLESELLRMDADQLEQETLKMLNTIESVLPPKYKTCKPFIIGAACSWPVTALWLIFSRFIKQFINILLNMFGGMFNKIAKLSFGKF